MRSVIAAILLLAATTARALTIVGHDASTNDRFSSGYASNPVANTSASFLGHGYDLSGVGWNPDSPMSNFAMISNQFFVYSTHAGPGSMMNFFSPTQGVVSYAVSATNYAFTYNGQVSDFRVGRLAAALDPAHGITSYPVLDLPAIGYYTGLSVLIYGHGGGVNSSPRLGANVVDAYGSYDLNNDTVVDNYGIGYSFQPAQNGDSVFQSDDSSGPTFVPWNGSLALLGTHSAVGTISGTQYSIDTFIPIYFGQMDAQGIDFTTVPEPSRAMLLLTGACALLRRRHRAPRE